MHNPTKLQCLYADCSSVHTSQASVIDHVQQKHPGWLSVESPVADQLECEGVIPLPVFGRLACKQMRFAGDNFPVLTMNKAVAKHCS